MLFLGLFLAEILALYFLSKLLSQALFSLFKSIRILALIFLPGTIVHELAHVLMAGVLLVRTGDIEFMPEVKEGGRVKLGSAQIGQCDPFRRALIGFAPVIVGVSLIVGSLYYLILIFGINQVPLWALVIFLYILLMVSNTMFSSRKDLEGSIIAVTVVLLLFGVSYYFGWKEPVKLVARLFNSLPIDFLTRMVLFLLVPISLDLLIYGLIRLVSKK